MKEGEYRMEVIEYPEGFYQDCNICGRVLKTGKFLILIHILENGKYSKHYLGDKSQKHCGKEKKMLWCSETKERAESKMKKILSNLSKILKKPS